MKKIPLKNYFILALIIIATFFLLYYFYLWFSAYKEQTINQSIMNEQLTTLNYNDLSSYIVENNKVYIYASYIGNEQINNFEKDFSTKVRKEGLKSKILYLDLTDILNSSLPLDYDLSKDKLPSILVFNSGVLEGTYNIKKNNYDVSKTIAYLISKDIKDL